MDLYETEASLAYIVNVRPTGATGRPCLKKTKNKRNFDSVGLGSSLGLLLGCKYLRGFDVGGLDTNMACIWLMELNIH